MRQMNEKRAIKNKAVAHITEIENENGTMKNSMKSNEHNKKKFHFKLIIFLWWVCSLFRFE